MTLVKILFLDQSGQLGGAELSLADIVTADAICASVLLFQDGPFRKILEAKGVDVQVISMETNAAQKTVVFGKVFDR